MKTTKISLHDIKNFMLDSEMKQVYGGLNPCAYGERLFTCTTTFDGGIKSTGSACALNSSIARYQVENAKVEQGSGPVDVVCR